VQHIHNATQVTGSNTTTTLGLDELRDLYAYPEELAAPWLRVNFISTIDGAAHLDGSSTGLGTPSDKQVFGVLRELADVILVGAGTARAEDYGGARTNEARREWRLDRGLAAVPPVAIVSAGAHIDPTSRLLTDTSVAPIILTCTDAPAERKAQLTAAGAEVLEIGTDQVSTEAILTTLEGLGLDRILCEGGPSLFGQLVADDAVDELCITTSPLLVSGTTGRIAVSPQTVRTPMARAHLLTDDDGTVLTRWVRARPR
jgi:riboflavin biosynthesis pyrimidine reductase